MKENSINNILYLCADTGIRYWGNKGASTHVREFSKTLSGLGYDVTMVARLGRKDPEKDSDFIIHSLPKIPEKKLFDKAEELGENTTLLGEMKSFYQNAYLKIKLNELYSSRPFDLIYERYSLFSVAGLEFAREKNIPFIMEVNAPLVLEASQHRALTLVKLAMAVEKYLFAEADHIIAVSQELKDYILSITPEAKVVVVPNGVSVQRFEHSEMDQKLPQSLRDIKDTDFLIGFVGRLRPWHGIEILIDSFAEFNRIDPNSKLVIIGDDGGMKDSLLKRCNNLGKNKQIIFTGPVSFDEIPIMLNRIDVMVAPYPKLHNFYFSSLKIFEYMAAGKPIIASRIGQIDKILTHQKTALLVSPGSRKALHEALQLLRNYPNLREELGLKARKEVLKNHTWKHRVETVTGLFKAAQNKYRKQIVRETNL